MIPLRLTIENFMCYREGVPTLDLENVEIACLTGDNGHGKTALLDSITWAIWGKARARTQEELVHQGKRTMRVDLDFSSHDQIYRVTRIHSKSTTGSAGKTELNLSILKEGMPVSIMGNTIRDTEQQIIDLLHMDYDTFISTSYLRQGDADQFTRSRPAERKQILAEVLDLSYYERLEKKSREKTRGIQSSLVGNKALFETRSSDISNKEDISAGLKKALQVISKLAPIEKETNDLNITLALKKDGLDRDRSEVSDLESAIRNSSTELEELKVQSIKFNDELDQLEALLIRADDIAAKKFELDEGRNLLSRMSQALVTIRELESDASKLEKYIALEERELKSKIEHLNNILISDLIPAAENILASEKKLADLHYATSKNSQKEKYLEEKESQRQSMIVEANQLELENKSVLDEMEQTRKRFDLLEDSDASCPVCDQPLGKVSRNHLKGELESQGNRGRHKYRENQFRISELREEAKKSEQRLSRARTLQTKENDELEKAKFTVEAEITDCREKRATIPKVDEELRSLSERYEKRIFSLREQSQLRDIEKSILNLGYDNGRHADLEQKVRNLEPFGDLFAQIEQAAERRRSLREFIDSNAESSRQREFEISGWNTTMISLKSRISESSEIEKALSASKVRLEEIRTELQSAISSRDLAQNSLREIETFEREIETLNKQILEDSKELEIYEELAAAFGRNGIQALMIERAVPQIEETANELLGNLTDNRMAVRLQLKEGRIDRITGLRSEELDISISDEVGTRSYETFSGGEAFRIDFAIRISLSKLLASRSGAPLPILFIDEGFGSQDSSGQERLTEVIQSIQSEFEKIIVITHIDQMKESFEERIEVLKTEHGSTFKLV